MGYPPRAEQPAGWSPNDRIDWILQIAGKIQRTAIAAALFDRKGRQAISLSKATASEAIEEVSKKETGERPHGHQRRSTAIVLLVLSAFSPLLSPFKFCRRQKWSRRELNPRPETTQMAASTCLAFWFNLDPTGDQRAASDWIMPSESYLSTNGRMDRPARVLRPMCCGHHTVPRLPLIRQPLQPGRQSRLGLQHRCWQLLFAHFVNRAK